MIISPSTTGQQLTLLLTGKYTLIHMSKRWLWVWVVGDVVHISDTIGGGKLHLVGKMGDRLDEFRPANGILSGRQGLINDGYSVGIEDTVLVVRKKGKGIYSHATDGDTREYQGYLIRGWRVARRHNEGTSMDEIVSSEEYWWEEVKRVNVPPPPDFFRMTQDELREWRTR